MSRLLTPYTDDDDHLLCPRYAENDPTSAPPSPASIESFGIMDSIPWRRSYISLDDSAVATRLHQRRRARRTRVIALSLLMSLSVVAVSSGGYLALQHGKSKT
jgi:hypothetical protein